jgi:predicted GTPase
METNSTAAPRRIDSHRVVIGDTCRHLRTLSNHARELGLSETVARLEEVVERTEQDVFRVAVVGEFKRGKSTLINALLGQSIIPSDVLPCSATLNRVTYGLTPRVTLVLKPGPDGKAKEETISIDALADYVTKLTPESERRASDVLEAVIHHPSRYCRDKADIIDTPGLNDDEAMTSVTLGVLPRVDAAVFVILAQSPFSGFEGEFLNQLLTNDMGRILFVVNRMDEIRREADRVRVLDMVRSRIEQAVRDRATELHPDDEAARGELLARLGHPRVFGVSAGDALDAKLAGDDAKLAVSNFPSFEAGIENVLVMERGLVKLLVSIDAGAAAARKISQQSSIRHGALTMQADEFQAAYNTTAQALRDLRAQLDGELKRLEVATKEVDSSLRPRARAFPTVILEAARKSIDTYPLTRDAIGKSKVAATAEGMSRAVTDAVKGAARRESEKIQLAIDKAIQAEVAHLATFGARLEAELGKIELRFSPDEARSDSVHAGLGVGLATSVLGGALWGGALGGAINGYQVAGLRGAAVGAAAGVASGFGAAAGGLTIALLLGLPMTWPVVLPALALGGIASTFGARKVTESFFGAEQIDRFREAFREEILGQLEATAQQSAASMESGVSAQVKETFEALAKQAREELGGAIDQTRRTLDELGERRARSSAHRERDAQEVEAIQHEAGAIESHLRALSQQLRQSGAV